MPIFKYLGGHTKEPTFTYFENTNEPIRIKLGNISAIYSNKKWKIDNKPNDNDYSENNGNGDNEDNENEKDKHQYNKKLQKRNKELENENQQLKWKIEVLLLKLAEAKYEIEQLREAE
ncbi:hypothetical protein H8356DRAFT_1674701 [Neocallimastix lanati (nom. inval.)]|uniref:BZIP domain-containing protein n=1 Tax=Neocallimastix californiae TaxID=1754190 RepID=A0A1Y2AHF1_9FUNG|nr:hypothetical protein H8356DRAFT_1674701 [Neocallimastix sp. JGI-2020a]ORY21720.1 hypothetical protein LY90DRAFT_676149 [Neocallimastix californiae]|eukprot:ORY21720.1 hypothetical protein LY90DRAFT_676149 [Neocallimastix californiae]